MPRNAVQYSQQDLTATAALGSKKRAGPHQYQLLTPLHISLIQARLTIGVRSSDLGKKTAIHQRAGKETLTCTPMSIGRSTAQARETKVSGSSVEGKGSRMRSRAIRTVCTTRGTSGLNAHSGANGRSGTFPAATRRTVNT